MKKIILIISFLTIIKVQAQTAGSYDFTFDGDGKAKYCPTTGNQLEIISSGLQSTGKIVSCGIISVGATFNSPKIALLRYNINGSLDTSFGANGALDPAVENVLSNILNNSKGLVQPDDKILVFGNLYPSSVVYKMVRFTANGSLDTTLNGTGYLDLEFGDGGSTIACIGLQQDEKILVGGNAVFSGVGGFSLTRLNSNGTIDSSFGLTGTVIIAGNYASIRSIALQPDGKIVVVGGETFSTNGGSSSDVDLAVFRFLTNGALDNSFATNGKLSIHLPSCSYNHVEKVLIQTDGKIVILGGRSSLCGFSDAVLIRLNANGSYDNTFGTNGFYYLAPMTVSEGLANDMAIQVDGKILVCGNTDTNLFRVARINANGTVDITFANAGLLSNAFYTDSFATRILIQPDNKIVVCGSTKDVNNSSPFCSAVIRLNAGTLGVEGFEFSNFALYPNPTTGKVSFNSESFENQKFSVIVTNLLGQQVFDSLNVSSNNNEIDLSNLGKGTYFITFANENQTITKKIIKN